MRQLKGKVKENRKQKKERKEENQKIHQQLYTIALPVLGVLFLFVAAYVFMKTRPNLDL